VKSSKGSSSIGVAFFPSHFSAFLITTSFTSLSSSALPLMTLSINYFKWNSSNAFLFVANNFFPGAIATIAG